MIPALKGDGTWNSDGHECKLKSNAGLRGCPDYVMREAIFHAKDYVLLWDNASTHGKRTPRLISPFANIWNWCAKFARTRCYLGTRMFVKVSAGWALCFGSQKWTAQGHTKNCSLTCWCAKRCIRAGHRRYDSKLVPTMGLYHSGWKPGKKPAGRSKHRSRFM